MKKRMVSVICCLIGLVFILMSHIEYEGNSEEREVKVVSKTDAGFWDGVDDEGNPTGGKIFRINYIYKDSYGFYRLSDCTVLVDIEVGDTTTLEADIGSGLNLTLFCIGALVIFVSSVVFLTSSPSSKNNSED